MTRILRQILLSVLLSATLWGGAAVLPYSVLPSVELPASVEINTVYFDRQGLMWIGTASGLRSFDGIRVRRHAPDGGVVAGHAVLSIAEGGDGRLWLGTRSGVLSYDRRTGRWRQYGVDGHSRPIVYLVHTTRDGTVWAGTDHCLSRYDCAADSFVSLRAPQYVIRRPDGTTDRRSEVSVVKSIAESPDGKYMYVGTWRAGLFRIRRGGRVFHQWTDLNGAANAYSLYPDAQGRLWIGSWHTGLMVMSSPTDFRRAVVTPVPARSDGRTLPAGPAMGGPLPYTTVYSIVEDAATRRLWVCSREGLGVADPASPASGVVYYSEDRLGTPLGINATLARSPLGTLWLCHRYRQISQYTTSRPPLTDIAPQPLFDRPPYPVYAITSVETTDGRHFWLGLLPYGIAYYDRQTGRTLYNGEAPGLGSVPQKIFSSVVPAVMTHADGSLWIATTNDGLIVAPPAGRGSAASPVVIDRKSQPGLPDNVVNTFHQDADGTVWIGTRSGLAVWRPGQSGARIELAAVRLLTAQKEDLTSCDIRYITRSRDGRLWLATEDCGVICLSGAIARRYAPADASAVYQDRSGRLFAVSPSGGLYLYDSAADSFAPYGGADCRQVYSIAEDRLGRLWVTAQQGLVCLPANPDDEAAALTLTPYSNAGGGLLFYPNTMTRYGSELYTASGSRLLAYSTESRGTGMSKPTPASVAVTGVRMETGRTAEPSAEAEHYRPGQPIVVPAGCRKLTVEFALLDYASPRSNRCQYRLVGYDRQWRQAEADDPAASYENLPPGNYRLLLRATDGRHAWRELPGGVEVRVLPPWWRTWWACCLWAALAGLLVWLAVRQYKALLLNRNRLQMAVLLTNIAHDLLTPLAVISALTDGIRRRATAETEACDAVENNIQRLTRLLRQMLEVRKQQAGRLTLQAAECSLTEVVRQECEVISPLVSQRGQRLDVDLEEVVAVVDGDKVSKILANLLSNAVKYTPEGGSIAVALVREGTEAVITVADTGRGISPERRRHLFRRFYSWTDRAAANFGTGIGLSLTRDLVLLHHGAIVCLDRPGGGTVFRVSLPGAKPAAKPAAPAPAASGTLDNAQVAPQPAPVAVQPAAVSAAAGSAKSEASAPGATVLIVDDNTELLRALADGLATRYRVLTAVNGAEALHQLEQERADVVATDIVMPVMDGFELCRKVKSAPETAAVPVLVFTARTSDNDIRAAYAAACDDYITKPFRTDDLIAHLDELIADARAAAKPAAPSPVPAPAVEPETGPKLSAYDAEFIAKATECVMEHIADTEYTRERLARDVFVSSSTLYNKVRAVTGKSVSAFITSVRLKEALRIAAADPQMTLTEIADRVGYNSPKYLSRCFKKEYGMLLREYLAQRGIRS